MNRPTHNDLWRSAVRLDWEDDDYDEFWPVVYEVFCVSRSNANTVRVSIASRRVDGRRFRIGKPMGEKA